MRTDYFGIRDQSHDQIRDGINFPYPVVDKKDLPSPLELIGDGIPDYLFLESVKFSSYRLPVGWRRGNHGKIPSPHQGKMERSRDRRSGKGEDIHVDPHLL